MSYKSDIPLSDFVSDRFQQVQVFPLLKNMEAQVKWTKHGTLTLRSGVQRFLSAILPFYHARADKAALPLFSQT